MSTLPNIPPAILYVFGLIIVSLGGLRAYHLGWKRRPAAEAADAAATEGPETEAGDEAAAKEEEPAEDAPRRPAWSRADGGGYKRHITMGLLWVAMGLFLIISTALNNR
jgi:hypothetical protein